MSQSLTSVKQYTAGNAKSRRFVVSEPPFSVPVTWIVWIVRVTLLMRTPGLVARRKGDAGPPDNVKSAIKSVDQPYNRDVKL